ncbi:hypothetical protein [Desulfatitalea tepidiphila]|nr:hypothetical protein [Desulfatitalea tepidiphila]
MRSGLNGIVVVDKPAGMSSAKVVAEVKKKWEPPEWGIPERWTPSPPAY